MYQDKVAVALKVNGKVLREFGDTVYIPFGSEYSIFIKNMNSLRCLVNIEIDGQDVGGGNSFVVPANSAVDIERFIKSSNLVSGQRFKFIERTSKIEQHRGVGVEDGLIRISFEFEKKQVPVPISTWRANNEVHHHHHYFKSADRYYGDLLGSTSSLGDARSMDVSKGASLSNVSFSANAAPINDTGITVGGSVSSQKFESVSSFATDGEEHVIVLKLLGEVGQTKLSKPVTVKTKQKCPTCGHTNKATAKFCAECGTGLILT